MKKMNEPGRTKLTLIASAFLLVMLFVPAAATAADAPGVTIQNYVRAETDLQMRTYVENMDAVSSAEHPNKELLLAA